MDDVEEQIEHDHDVEADTYLCSDGSRSSKQLLRFSIQCAVALLILIFSMVQIIRGAESTNIYFSLIASILGLFSPSPSPHQGKGKE